MNRTVSRWWGRPFPYERARRFGDAVIDMTLLRRAIAASTASIAIGSAFALASPASPEAPLPVAFMVACVVVAVPVCILWWRGPWPTERTSLAFVAYADLSIATCLLLYSDPALAMAGTCLFSVVGLYVVLLHGAREVLAHASLGLLTVVALVARVVAGDGDGAIAVSAGLALTGAVAGVPLMLYAAWAPVRGAAWESMTDPLTGLVNRRGLEVVATRLRPASAEADAVVAVIDLDRFKTVNDTAGHAAGDEVLRRVSARMLAVSARPSVVARTGGEEFVCVTAGPAVTPALVGRVLLDAVHDEADPHPVTASVGVTSLAGRDLRRRGLGPALARADRALYRAKDEGRGRFVVDGGPGAPP